MPVFKAPFSSFPVGAIIRQGTKTFKKTSDCEYGSYDAKSGKIGREQCAEHWEQFIAVDQEWLDKREKQKKNQSLARREKDDMMRSLGLTKVRGSVSGKIYWE